MIVDKLDSGTSYLFGMAWNEAFDFLTSITPEIEEGEYKLSNNDILARVMSYQTREPKDAALEAHRKYVDIQVEWSSPNGHIVKQR